MTDLAFERGFVAGWEARGRHYETAAIEEELRLRREAEEARQRSMSMQNAQQQAPHRAMAGTICAICGTSTGGRASCIMVGCPGFGQRQTERVI